jgi:hypothetical protein
MIPHLPPHNLPVLCADHEGKDIPGSKLMFDLAGQQTLHIGTAVRQRSNGGSYLE